jgi:DMSO/TMAO reductase YedYZ molybdopterin-dependent catalytic subunit/thiosulfate reductase cytochrome b subunit
MPLDFPLWIRLTHVLNVLFLTLLARSGIEILGAHPKLYWNDDCRPGGAWLRLTRKRMPTDRIWTSKDEEESLPSWLALPGRRNLGLGRHWHFATVLAWILTGTLYVVLLFATDEWRRLIPTSWSVFPDAWDTLLVYLHFNVPEQIVYNPLQQLSYFAVVFLLSPFMLLTGAAMSPAIAAQFPWYIRLFGGRQNARSLHFLSLLAFAAFTIVHTAMVIVHDLPEGWAKIVLGSRFANHTRAIVIGCIGLAIILLINVIAPSVSLRAPRFVQRALGLIVDPAQRALSGWATSRQRYAATAISPYYRINGLPPVDPGYQALASNEFRDWRLDVGGLVRNPLCLSLADLRTLPAESQTTKHNCIQGWSAVAKWTGLPMRDLLERCEPLPEARYVVFHALDDKGETDPDLGGTGHYFEVLDIDLARTPQTLLAYEMNGTPLPIEHGAPLRLRVETQLGFKMVKYLRAIELVADYRQIGEGYGGWREDVQHYSRTVGI